MTCSGERSTLEREYEYIAHQINREDGLVNNRMTWVVQLNGFLFTALALAGRELPSHWQQFFALAIPAVGVAVTFSGLVGLRAANLQLKYLQAMWSEERFPNWPRPFGDPQAHRLGKWPAHLPLFILLGAWGAFLAHVAFHR